MGWDDATSGDIQQLRTDVQKLTTAINKFSITSTILSSCMLILVLVQIALTVIASAREVIEQTHLEPELEAELRRQALLRSTHASTALAGNKLSFKQVEMLYSRRNKKTKQ